MKWGYTEALKVCESLKPGGCSCGGPRRRLKTVGGVGAAVVEAVLGDKGGAVSILS